MNNLFDFLRNLTVEQKNDCDREKLLRFAAEEKAMDVQRKLCKASVEVDNLRSEIIVLKSKALNGYQSMYFPAASNMFHKF